MQEAPHPFHRLQRLSFRFDITFDSFSTGVGNQFLVQLLTFLQSASLDRRDLTDVTDLAWVPPKIAVPSLRTLSIEGKCDDEEMIQDLLQGLPSLFTLFPALKTLLFKGDFFAVGCEHPAVAYRNLVGVPLSPRFPPMSTALLFFKTTNLLNFHNTTTEGDRERRWSRRSREEDFVCKGWTLV